MFDESFAGLHRRCCKLVSDQVPTLIGTTRKLIVK
jgi:hypothetical protein